MLTASFNRFMEIVLFTMIHVPLILYKFGIIEEKRRDEASCHGLKILLPELTSWGSLITTSLMTL